MRSISSAPRAIAAVSIVVAFAVIVAMISLGFAAPGNVHPMYYFVLIAVGGGGFALLVSGVLAVFAGSRTPTTPARDLEFFAGIRRGALAMAIVVTVVDALGVLLLLRIAGPGSPVVFVAAAATWVCAIVTAAGLSRQPFRRPPIRP